MRFGIFGLGSRGETTLVRPLSDPQHPVHKQLQAAAAIIDRCVKVEVLGDQSALHVSGAFEELSQALRELDAAIQACPEDLNLMVAKACTLHVSAQFKSAEEILDQVLAKDPGHFEARMWKDHWNSWLHALRFPSWNAQMTSLQPAMTAHLRAGHRVQLVRDGFQKVVAIVAEVQGPPFDPKTRIQTEWMLSETPVGPLVAYYLKLIEPAGEPSTMEAFLPVFPPSLFAPMEGCYLAQQLAFCPYAFVVLVNSGRVDLNRKIEWGPRNSKKLSEIQSNVARRSSFLAQADFQRAVQWHMNNFDMSQASFE